MTNGAEEADETAGIACSVAVEIALLTLAPAAAVAVERKGPEPVKHDQDTARFRPGRPATLPHPADGEDRAACL